ncbi:MAG: undecaprenyl-diphosphate phosphatase [Oscillospiraceae bacterium]|nr:undecaprenyl-diphosphate phosphatase [Oscillospiraceae bacterium]
MPDQLLHKFIYVLFSAFTEFLPVSPRAHQILYELLTGFQMTDKMVTLSIHIGVFVALIINNKKRIQHLVRANRLARYARRHRNTHVDTTAILDTRVLKTTIVPVLIGLLFLRKAEGWIGSLAMLALMLTINGFIIFLPRIMLRGNKDGRNLSRLDSVIMGIGGGLGVIPGFSRMGGILSGGQIRGVDRSYAMDVALLASIPALLGLIIIDLFAVIAAKATISALAWLCYLIMAIIAFGIGYLAVLFLRYLCAKASFTRFSYYSWGMAMFAFMIYLLI